MHASRRAASQSSIRSALCRSEEEVASELQSNCSSSALMAIGGSEPRNPARAVVLQAAISERYEGENEDVARGS
jgi:hypothetical protein